MMTQPSNIYQSVLALPVRCRLGVSGCGAEVCLIGKSAKYANTGPQQKTKGNTVSRVNLSIIYSTIGGRARSNCGFVSGKRRGTLRNSRSSDLAGNQ